VSSSWLKLVCELSDGEEKNYVFYCPGLVKRRQHNWPREWGEEFRKRA